MFKKRIEMPAVELVTWIVCVIALGTIVYHSFGLQRYKIMEEKRRFLMAGGKKETVHIYSWDDLEYHVRDESITSNSRLERKERKGEKTQGTENSPIYVYP